VPYEGDLETAKVMFIGEAPGKQEDEDRRPFVGRAGQYLREAVGKAEIGSEDVIYTNVCKCRPINNRTPVKKEIDRCKKKFLMDEIEQFKGDLIVLLGAVPLQAILGKGGLLNNRGYGFTAHGKHVFVTYHPAYVLRNLNTRVEEAFHGDISKVKAYIDNDFSINKVNVDTQDDLELMLTELLEWDGQCNLAFDIETTGYETFDDDVLSIAFSAGDKNWFIPLEHDESPWKGKSDWVMKQLAQLFTDDKFRLIGQNAKFDIKFLRRRYGITVSNLWFDTMVAHYLLVGKFIPHTLKGMAWRYTNNGGYEIDREQLSNIPLEEVARYNVWDTRMTLDLARYFIRQVADSEQFWLMTETIAPATQAIAEMELEGVQLDVDKLEEMLERYITEVTDVENRMMEYPIIKRYMKEQGKKFNFGSTKQLREVFEMLRIDTRKVSKKTGAMSTDEEALKNVEGKHGLVNDLLDFRKKNKVLGTYLKPYVENNREGRIHADYSFITTATGRLSSFNPNFQNIPYDTRPVFISKNGLFLEFDYSQLELRVLAMIANDIPMIEDFSNGVDIHEGTRLYMYGDNSDKSSSVRKEQRVQAKTVNFSIVYGTGYKSLAKELKKSERIAKQWLDTWYRKHPAVRRYQNMVWDYVKENGYIDTPFGRTRFFNLRRPGLTQGQMNAMYREAINMPIQGTASDIVLTGLGRLWKWMRQEGFRSQMVWEVHDSIGIDCYENEIETIILKGKEILEGVSYKWMRGVPLVVDVSVGKHWGRLEELEV
jgi:DNA polymerase-1